MTNVMSERARQFRKAKGPAERRLWRKLRELNRHGFHFRQQAPIGRYIADFADHERRVIIELYGSHHGLAEQQKADQDRTRWLEKQGYRVIRFWNVQVVENIDGVMTEILSAVGFIAEPTSPPPLWGRPGGGDAEPLAAANVQANPSREFKSSPSRDPQSTTSRTPPTARSGIPPTARSGTPPTPSPSPQGGGGFEPTSPPPSWGRPGGGDAGTLAAGQTDPPRETGDSSPERSPTATSGTPPTACSGIPPTACSGTPPTPSPSPQGGGGSLRSSGPRGFAHVDTWIFDLDNTLYPASCDLFSQVDHRMGEFIAKTLGVPYAHARHLQKAYYRQFGTTLSGLMQVHKLKPEPFLEYVHDIDLSVLPELPELATEIEKLPGRRLIFTNGSRRHAENVAAKIGVLHLFEDICDIAALDFVPKPERNAFERMARLHDISTATSAMFEDMPHNLEVPHDLGMSTVLVHSDYVDHPVQLKMRSWTALPDHIHHMTKDLTGFLSGMVNGGPQSGKD